MVYIVLCMTKSLFAFPKRYQSIFGLRLFSFFILILLLFVCVEHSLRIFVDFSLSYYCHWTSISTCLGLRVLLFFFLSLKLYYLCLYSVRSSIQLLAIYEQCSEDVNVIIYGTLCWWMLPFDVYSVFFCLFVCKFKGIHAWHQYIDTNNSWFIIFM